MQFNQVIQSYSAEETRNVGEALAACLQPGDIVLLSGDLGAGKTQFVQGVAAAFGITEVPVSPTFNIVISYESGRIPLHHFDLYRLDSASQLEDIGVREYLESGGVCLIEWAEKFPLAFEANWNVSIKKVSAHERSIQIVNLDKASSSINLDKIPSSSDKECASKVNLESIDLTHRAIDSRFVLSFDTANEVVAIGIGELNSETHEVRLIATHEIAAHRASNTMLMPTVDALLQKSGITRTQIACVGTGRGPGSFTGVRICMATAKGIASALGVGLVGVSTLDAIAWNAWEKGVRGDVAVIADAMRKEVYPVRYELFNDGVQRMSVDRVVKASDYACELAAEGLTVETSETKEPADEISKTNKTSSNSATHLYIVGDALMKYRALFEPFGEVLSDKLWEVTGRGLLLALQAAWRAYEIDPFDITRHNPAFILPVYTRLSDAEENERIRLAQSDEKNLTAGVQNVAFAGSKGRATMHAQAPLVARADETGVTYYPLAVEYASVIARLEADCMKSDAWNERMVASELGQSNRTWWVAEYKSKLVGYAGGIVSQGDLAILKVAVAATMRRQGIARELVSRIAEDARNLGAMTCSLEVRASNAGAQAFYESLGLRIVGARAHYYSDGEDAVIMQGALPSPTHDVAGMTLQRLQSSISQKTVNVNEIEPTSSVLFSQTAVDTLLASSTVPPFILAIESSCDETAAAVISGNGQLLSDVLASQINFHARFGGVVPEIASRKHIEAICGVCTEALQVAGITWKDLDSIAVTYAPGLLGALVVGMAFAKGAAWALDVPLVGVNHLEGHVYANKIGVSVEAPFEPPAVISLVSGGNTMLAYMRDWADYEVLGETIDDAVGEAFDKVAKALGLGYPGGPVIAREAKQGDADSIVFPRAMMHSHDFRFSLSGLKTAVVNYINQERAAGHKLNIPNIAASFQQAVIDVQVAKATTALKLTSAPVFCLGGGVAANSALRTAYEEMCAKHGVRLIMPPLSSCGDNAGMIALVALDRYKAGKFFSLDSDACAHANLAEPY